jgi:hypothetical protein
VLEQRISQQPPRNQPLGIFSPDGSSFRRLVVSWMIPVTARVLETLIESELARVSRMHELFSTFEECLSSLTLCFAIGITVNLVSNTRAGSCSKTRSQAGRSHIANTALDHAALGAW